ncbi:MAG: type II toxin-antitoxin system VapC family toxin [Litorimonas sp.]
MRILLDTQAILYAFAYPERLPYAWEISLKSKSNQFFVSAASPWEVAIKSKDRKPDFFNADPYAILEGCRLSGFRLLDITPEVAVAAGKLPLHHKDPFDRVIIAHAMRLGVPVMTTDRKFKLYDVDLVSA